MEGYGQQLGYVHMMDYYTILKNHALILKIISGEMLIKVKFRRQGLKLLEKFGHSHTASEKVQKSL